MGRASRRAATAIATVVAVLGGMFIGVPTAALADVDEIPLTGQYDAGDPIPGDVLGAKSKAGLPSSSRSVKAEQQPVIDGVAPELIDVPVGDVDVVQTEGSDKTDPAVVIGEWQEVGNSGVAVASAETADEDRSPEALTVSLLSDAEADELRLVGPVVSLALEGEEDDVAPVGVSVPVDLLEGTFGADFESRVQWVQVPIADGKPLLEDATPIATASMKDSVVLTPAVSSAPTMVTALAGATSTDGTGSYAATPLKSSSTWDVAEQTGAFTWSYDMPVPGPGIGPVPSVSLAYNSQAVDGATASTNNQPSAVGEGWDITGSGFIERSYVPCAKDDGASGAVATSGDLCWRTDNATISFGGHSGALIKDTTSGKWRLQNDDGTRFEHLSGTAAGCAANGTASTDCWKMTTTDGTQYFFGLNRLPGWSTGKAVTNSTWTVPVFGNDAGEPCHASTFAASSCMQAWRWNLDYIVDVHGNAQALYYTAETNKYAKNGTGATVYQRGGVLSKIEYGLRASNVYGANAAGYRVLFTYDSKGRCNGTGSTCTTAALDAATMPAHPSAYPDVPFDQLCTGTSCSASQIVPSFFTNARLATVKSQALVSSSYSTVDTWTLSHSYPAPGDGTSPALWLTQVQRTGTAAGQSAINEPATVFSGTTMQNRVWVTDGLAPLDKWRLSSIKTSLGAIISVNYQAAQCTPAQASAILADLPNNTKWCFPSWWVPESTIPLGGRQDLFHKYPVKSIVMDPVNGGPLSKVQQTDYSYGTPRWRYNDSPLTVANSRTWNVFAGVDTVEVREGNPATPSALKVSKYTYYQGMNGDRASDSGGTKTVNVAGTSIADQRWFGGQLYRQQTLVGVGGAVISSEVYTPWASAVTSNDGSRAARMTAVQKTVVTEPVSTGGSRTLTTQTTFDATYGYPLTVSTAPSDAAGTCVTTDYASANTTKWIIGLPSRVTTVEKTCATIASASYPDDLLGDSKTVYDGLAWDAAATRGLPTSTQAVDRYDGSTPHWSTIGTVTYDTLGRVLTTTDALGRTSSTAYSPAAAVPLLSTTVTNPAPFSWAVQTTYEPTTGSVSQTVDPNGSTTTIAVDALGRASKVWLPLRTKAANPDSPSLSFEYTLSQTTPNAVKSSTVTGGGTVSTFELFDGLGRNVQTQSSAVGGGAVVKTTNYDDQGRVYFVDNEYWTASISPGTAFFTPDSENNIPSQVITAYDAVGRTLTSTLNSSGAVHSQTVTTYGGADRVDTTPPAGGTPTRVITNSLGQQMKLVQYLGGTISGSGQETTYVYDGGGRMTAMTDPAGNDWTWTYDLLGNRAGQDDPDSGASSATYDLVGNKTSTTDARGVTVATAYDALNRRTAVRSGSSSGPLLASWTYDTATLGKGYPASSTSYTGSTASAPGLAYTTSTSKYDAAGNPLDSTVSIPSGAPAFAGTSYTTTNYYHPDSTLLAKVVPAVGGLPSETIRYSYDSWGRLSGIRGASIVLGSTIYTPIGQLAEFTRPNGVGRTAYSTYGYDPATGQIASIVDNAVFDGSGHYVAQRSYTRDKAGNVTSEVFSATHPTAVTQKTCYSYDGLRQLTRAWTPAGSTSCSTAPSVAGLGGASPYWVDYAYDMASGNRTSTTVHAASGDLTAEYAYADAGDPRPHAVTEVTGDAALGTGEYSYDDAGNQTSRPGQSVTFDAVGKVVEVSEGSETLTQVFDADGNLLLSDSSSSGASLFLGETTLSQGSGVAAVEGFRTYAGAGGRPVAQRSAVSGVSGSTVAWLFSDEQGTVDVRSNATSGATTQQYRDPFGGPLAGTGPGWADGKGFLDKPVAVSVGLTVVGARTYDPVLGKFLSVDPVIDTGLPQQNTGYAYSGNNPITYSDPSGLKFAIANAEASGQKPKSEPRKFTQLPGCKWGSPNCRGASSRSAHDGIVNGQVDPCRAFNPKKCEVRDELVRPGLEWYARLGTLVTDFMGQNYWARDLANLPATGLALLTVALGEGKCGYSETAGIQVCSGSAFAQRGGTTIGSVFLTTGGDREIAEILSGGSDNEALLAHEGRHASQWAGYGNVSFALAYSGEMLLSQITTGDVGCGNFFEHDAGMLEGGYSAGCQ
ncbi:RHS repeat domain-containing protein [Microbacterium tumbae]